MHKAGAIIIVWLAAWVGGRAASPADTLAFVRETETVAPVVPDTEQFRSFKAQKEFDYYRRTPDKERSNTLGRLIRRFLSRLFDVDISDKQANIFAWVVMVLVALGVLVLIFKYKPKLFFSNRAIAPATYYTASAGDALPADFDRLIAAALAAGNYADAIRWRYLHTLKILEAEKLIEWNVDRTASEYVAAFARKDLLPPFARLSRLFLYARYGHFETHRHDYDEAEQLALQITQSLR